MPYLELKVFEDRFVDPEFPDRMIAALTEAVSSVLGPEAGADTTVIVEGVQRARWGHGGRPMTRPGDMKGVDESAATYE
ncbi:tautomerase family protein [Patulibacter sp. NPDC049589]|uniref:tautomerase family protein n=1 Tax=Patulibacter sp. NPDC049589 TaxID=3154731 RepID=UPI003446CD8B